jgi:pyruvate dehydrogenase (quinone)
MSKRVADLLIETLQAACVKTCYGIVGDTMNQIAHAIDRARSILSICGMNRPAPSRPLPKHCSLAVSRPAQAAAALVVSTFINSVYEGNRNRALVR